MKIIRALLDYFKEILKAERESIDEFYRQYQT